MDNITSNDASAEVTRVLADIRQKVDALTALGSSYPADQNFVRPVSKSPELSSILPTHLPSRRDLRTFYELCDGVDLPDVGNGIFLHRRALLATNAKRRLPVLLREGGAILVFGSDGGGGLFAVPAEAGEQVMHLPNGAVLNGQFDNIRYPIKIAATHFAELLYRIVADVSAVIEGSHNWRFLTS